MSEPLPILLLLDLSTDNPLDTHEVVQQLPEQERSRARVVLATEHGATRSGRGSPAVWFPCADAVVKMVEHARGLAKEAGAAPKFYVAGRAGLPLFAQLGCELSAWADVTVLNQRKDSSWDTLSLRAPGNPAASAFFTVSVLEHSEQAGRVSVIVATSPPRQEAEARSYMLLQDEPPAGAVMACASTETPSGPKAAFLDHGNAAQAARELDELFTAIPSRFPNATGLSLFIDGPASLALMVGRALNPKVLKSSAWVPNYDGVNGGGYYPALSLPYKIPPVGVGARGELVAILHAPKDAKHLEGLIRFLQPLEQDGTIHLWHADGIAAGTSIDEAARQHLERARLVVVLASADFLANERLMGRVEQALRSEKATGARVVPVVVKPCSVDRSALAGRQRLPRSVSSVSEARNTDKVWLEVAEELQKILDTMSGKPPVAGGSA